MAWSVGSKWCLKTTVFEVRSAFVDILIVASSVPPLGAPCLADPAKPMLLSKAVFM